MLAQRIKSDFHYIGFAIAAVLVTPGLMAFLAAVPLYADWHHIRGPSADPWWGGVLLVGMGYFAVGALTYVVARAVGWIIAGFVGDGENSN